jgi:hypothetical protein
MALLDRLALLPPIHAQITGLALPTHWLGGMHRCGTAAALSNQVVQQAGRQYVGICIAAR